MISVEIAALLLAVSGVGETVLLDFQAPWCAPCRSMEGTIDEIDRAGYPVRKVNIDRERALAAQYHVESIPCFVLVVDGKEVDRLTGASRRAEIVSMFSKAGVGPGGSRHEIARGQSPDPPRPSIPLPTQQARDPFPRARAIETSAPVAAPRAGSTAHDLIAASVRLSIQDDKGYSYGSGTMIDARQGTALILTCAHIFRDSQGKGPISVDLCAPGAPQKLPGKLLAFDLKNDIGLVSIHPGGPVKVAPVAAKGQRVAKGDAVVTVGCNNGGPATAIETRVTAIDKFLGPANLQVAGLPVQGRSGGGLFNAEGQVIGVCNAADPADNEGLFAALPTIHGQLDQAGLTAVYERGPRANAALASAHVPSMPARMPGPVAAGGSLGAADAGASRLSEAERAALAAVQKQGDSAEVICIVRSLSNPQAKSEVIKLDRASSEFLKQLAADRAAQDGRQLTSLRVRPTRPQQ